MANNILKMSNAGGMTSATRYIDMLAGNTAYNPSSYESIATVTVGAGGSSSISFSSIPSTYKHLQIRYIARSSAAVTVATNRLQFNSDTGNNYKSHYVAGNGSSAFAGVFSETFFGAGGVYAGASASSSVFGIGVIDILDYTNTSKNTTTRALGGIDNNGSGEIGMQSSLWINTSSVSSITINPEAGNFIQYSSFALYGVKG